MYIIMCTSGERGERLPSQNSNPKYVNGCSIKWFCVTNHYTIKYPQPPPLAAQLNFFTLAEY